jgi:hypothetical protein
MPFDIIWNPVYPSSGLIEFPVVVKSEEGIPKEEERWPRRLELGLKIEA